MDTPARWSEQRFGLVVQNSVAAVPSWAPIGHDADRYRQHLGENGSDGLVEVIAHHRDRWGHVDRFDDFVELLTYDEFDAAEWAQLAVDAGTTQLEAQARDQDGWCWWDAPGSDRTTVARGPHRDVLAELASACGPRDIRFTARYSMSGPDGLHTSQVIGGDRAALQRAALAATFGADCVLPDRPPAEPWVLRRGMGLGLGHNRAERPEHRLTAFDVVDVLTEVVAKGGQLRLSIGTTASGGIPVDSAHALRQAGEWIRAHADLVHRSIPWRTWGDVDVRYLTVDGALYAVDLRGRGRFDAIDRTTHRVVSITGEHPMSAEAVAYRHDEHGLQIEPDRRPTGHELDAPSIASIRVFRIELAAVDAPDTLFEPAAFEPAAQSLLPLQPLLDGAVAGDIVQLGDAHYLGPVTVPPGVVLRGLGARRTTIGTAAGSSLRLERNARLEHVHVIAGADVGARSDATVEMVGDFATVLGCTVDGAIAARADGAMIRATSAGRITAVGCDHLTVSRCELTGSDVDVAIDLVGGDDHEIDSCTVTDHQCAVRASDTVATIVRGCTITSRWWGVRLHGTERAHIHGNRVSRTTRAIDVDGGSQALIDGNAVFDGDSGCVLQGGAAGCQVSGNYWERCRVGLLAWGAAGVHEQGNIAVDLHEPDHAIVIGP